MTINQFILGSMIAFVLFVSIPCWLSTLRQRRREYRDSTRRLTPEQYQDYTHRCARALHRYTQQHGIPVTEKLLMAVVAHGPKILRQP